MKCQPCHDQGRNSSAEFWCTKCEETLCYSCKFQHVSLKLGRNHNVSELPKCSVKKASCDKEKEGFTVKNNKWVLCDKHHDTSLEYFCTKHEKLCCILCKRQYHKDCCNVKKVYYVEDDSKLETTTENMLSEIKERKYGFIEAADNARLHLRDLDITNNKFKEELKNTRIAIDEQLDLFQNEVEQEINKTYENNRGELIKQVTDITAEIKYITDKQKFIEETTKLSIEQKYSTIVGLKCMDEDYNERYQTLKECCLQPITNKKLSYEKTNDAMTIRIDRILIEPKNKMDINLENENRISCSSAVKREPNVTVDFTLPLYLPFTYKSTLPAELPLNSPVKSSSLLSITQTTLVPWASTSEKGSSSFEFALTNSFYIEKGNRHIVINDAKLMPNKYDIAIAEKSNPRCMIYNKDGLKRGQILLIGIPHSIAVINSNRIGVSVI